MSATVLPRLRISPQILSRLCSTHTNLLSRSVLAFSSAATSCDAHLVHSPFPDVAQFTNLPVPEFVVSNWIESNGLIRDKVAIVDASTGQSRTFREYYHDMGAIAASLMYELGISERSTVALFAPNHVDYIPISLGAALCGCKLTPVNPQYKASELITILNDSRSEVLISHWSVLDVALEAMKQAQYVKHVVVIPEHDGDPIPDGTISLSSLKKHNKSIHKTCRSIHNDLSSHPFLLPYSSGTTGMPKGVCLSHTNITSNLQQMFEAESTCFPSDHKLISPLPMFHIYGFAVSALYPAWCGQQLITMSGRFDLEIFCQLIEKYQPQRAHIVPPILIGLAKSPVVEKYDLTSLKMCLSAAAPLGKETEDTVIDRISCPVKQAWGMSELSPIGTFTSDLNIRSGSVGQLASNTIGKVVDSETNKSLPPYQSGELMIKGPQVMMGYLNAPEKTAECLTPSGWLKTGDVAHYDKDGFFFITDRLKELIKVRGYQVAPAELEALLLTHENVDDAAVISVKSEESGELPIAYVVMKSDITSQHTREEDIKEWVKERVAPYKRLEGVIFIDEIPKSASGKILRRLIGSGSN